MTEPNIYSSESLFQALWDLKASPVLGEYGWFEIVFEALEDTEIPADWRAGAQEILEEAMGSSVEEVKKSLGVR